MNSQAGQCTLSLVICTRNRAAKLPDCLQAVRQMDRPDQFELIVVDNNSNDDTAAVIKRFAETAGFNVRYLFAPIPGLAIARNLGWRAATGDLVAFTDDDCYVDRGFAKALVKLFSADEALGFAGGRILLFDPEDLPITIKTSESVEWLPAGQFVQAGVIQGANFAFRRSALAAAGGFDPLLGAGTPFPSEDIEMVGRLSALGWPGMYSPEPLVYHHHGRRTEGEADRLHKGYDFGRGAYYMARIMRGPGRGDVIRNWYWKARRQAVGVTARELIAAIRYLLARGRVRYSFRLSQQDDSR